MLSQDAAASWRRRVPPRRGFAETLMRTRLELSAIRDAPGRAETNRTAAGDVEGGKAMYNEHQAFTATWGAAAALINAFRTRIPELEFEYIKILRIMRIAGGAA